MSSSTSPAVVQIERRQQVLEVLRGYVDRRSAGETVTDAEIIAAHEDLMPELARELEALAANLPDAETSPILTASDLEETLDVSTSSARQDAVQEVLQARGYRDLRKIRGGGQGIVYRAVQESTGQKVALKTLIGGAFAARDAQVRLVRETRILGSLRHPNIVRIHDSGAEKGIVYFVMEYLPGPQIDRHITEERLGIRAIAELFTKIADGVNAAHLRGVIHRDLKPSNVLIDAAGAPRLVDFGIAKVAPVDGGARHDLTQADRFVGTARYASPEQCECDHELIDVRTDVYSLGVMLFEALAGEMPYEATGTQADMRRRIVEQEPRSLRRVRAEIPTDLATIVHRCLRKEADERYQNAGELARDLRNFLAGQPIDAKRDNLFYVLAKRAARYRWPVTAAAAVLLFGVGQAAFANYMWGVVQDERDGARAVTDVLERTLTSLNPESAAESVETPLYRDLLDAADELAGRIDEVRDPAAAARLQLALGRLYLGLDRTEQAQQPLELAAATMRDLYGESTEIALDAELARGYALKRLGYFEPAEKVYLDVISRAEPFPLLHASATNHLGQLALAQGNPDNVGVPLLRQALGLRRTAGAPARDIATSQANLGSLLRDEAAAAREATQPATPASLALREQLLDEAEALLDQALATRRDLFGETHLHTAVTYNKLGLVQRERGMLAGDRGDQAAAADAYARAGELLARTREIKAAVLPAGHRDHAVAAINLGMLHNNLEDYAAARTELDRALTAFMELRHARGIERSLEELIVALRGQDALAEADAYFARARDVALVTPQQTTELHDWIDGQRERLAAEIEP